MSNPKPIKAGEDFEVVLIGGDPKKYLPYISIHYLGETPMAGHYINDRDIKRLKKWCEICLEGRKKK